MSSASTWVWPWWALARDRRQEDNEVIARFLQFLPITSQVVRGHIPLPKVMASTAGLFALQVLVPTPPLLLFKQKGGNGIYSQEDSLTAADFP